MRVGVLGTGRTGAFRAARLAEHPGVDEVLVGSHDPARARAVAEPLGARGLGSYDDVLDEGVDAVVVSTATPDHVVLIEAAAARGLPVFCEKPIALTLEDTERALAVTERAGTLLQIAFQRRFDRAWRAARDAVASGALGTVYSVRVVAHDHEPSPPEYIPTSGGIFKDLHVHDFDAVRWVTGEEVATAYAVGAVREWTRFAEHGDVDVSAILLTLESGVPVLISGSRHDARGYDFRAEITGSKDTVAVGWDDRTPVRSVEPGGPPPAPDPYRGFLDRFEPAFRAELDAFVTAVAEGGESPCPGSSSLEALRVAIACDASRAEGRPVLVR
jgi:myo-inositol 2-dehydrogenase/D-chiro-inositol 1-dehydrogenase